MPRFAGAPASCCSVPVWFVLLLVPRALVCRCVLCCFIWRSVVPCCVVWCVVVSCRAVLCLVVLCCLVVPCCTAVLCVFLCCVWFLFLFPLGPLPFLSTLKPLPHVLGKALSRPPGSCVPGGKVSPHVYLGRATCPLLWAAAPGAAQPCGISLTTRGIAPAGLRYNRLTLVA